MFSPGLVDRGFGVNVVLAGDQGFEPCHTDSESVVLPLDESPASRSILSRKPRHAHLEPVFGV